MSKPRQIRQLIKQIAGQPGDLFVTGQVKAVDGDQCTVVVGAETFEGVLLTPLVDDDDTKILITPKVGSTVLVADLSEGQRRLLQVVVFSAVQSITINGGELGGLVNVDDLVTKLNALVSTFNQHTHAVSTTGTAAAQTGTAAAVVTLADSFIASDFQDEKIKH